MSIIEARGVKVSGTEGQSPGFAWRRLQAWLCCLLITTVLCGPAWPATEPPAADNAEAVLAGLNDQQVRRLLLERLRQDISETPTKETEQGSPLTRFLTGLQSRSQALGERIEAVQRALPEAPASFEAAVRNLTDNRWTPELIKGLRVFAALLVAGLLAELAVGRLVRETRRALRRVSSDRWQVRLGYLALRLVLDLLLLAVFAVVAFSLSFLAYDRYEPMRLFVTTYLSVVLVGRGTWIVSRALLAPSASGLRLWHMADTDARAFHHWIVSVAVVAAFGLFSCALLEIAGLRRELHQLMVIGVGLTVTFLLAGFIWRLRVPLARLIGGDEGEGAARSLLAQVWHLIAAGYVLAVLVAWSINVLLEQPSRAGAAIASALLILLLPLLDSAVGRALRRGVAATEPRYAPLVRNGVRGLLFLFALLGLAEAWGMGVLSFLETPVGAHIGRAILSIGAACLIAYALWEIIKRTIDQHMPEMEDVAPGEEGSSGGATRSATLLPLLRSFALGVLVVLVALVVLSSLGVDIGPLLAGAGVVGLAIGFGSQKLVQDVVSGIFFLVDDAFRVGEYIEAGGLKGTVESISVRSLRLRHHLGAVQTLPYSEIGAVRNHSRDWVTMKLEIRLPYDTDVEKVRKIIKRTGQRMLEHPEYGKHFLQPLKSQGVMRVEESALIVRLKFTTVPNEQWVIRREAYRLVRDALADAGISFAHRQVQVKMPVDGETVDGPRTGGTRSAMQGGAASAVSTQIAESGSPPSSS